MQTRDVLDDGQLKKLHEVFEKHTREAPEDFLQRIAERAKQKLQEPKTMQLASKRMGRNDACLCGSGKKFKKCCLNKANKGEFEQGR